MASPSSWALAGWSTDRGPPALTTRATTLGSAAARRRPSIATRSGVLRRARAALSGSDGDALEERLGEIELEDQVGRAAASCLLDPGDDVVDGLGRAAEHAVEAMAVRVRR